MYLVVYHYSKILKIAGLLYFVKVSSIFGICSEFAMISMGGAIEPPIEIIANSLQIPNIELTFT